MQEFPFARACMKCTSKEDKGKQGFTYLSTDLPVPTSYIAWTIVFDLLIILAIWGVAYMVYTYEIEAQEPVSQRVRRRVSGTFPF
jgi:hypothetical protein